MIEEYWFYRSATIYMYGVYIYIDIKRLLKEIKHVENNNEKSLTLTKDSKVLKNYIK